MPPMPKIVLLMAEDDPEDRLLAERAFSRSGVNCELRTVEDGRQLMDYLNRCGDYADPAASPTPAMILLDLNMPVMDGQEVLTQLKASECLRGIPVVVLTTSSADADVKRCYDLGASSYIVKPASPARFSKLVEDLWRYWSATVTLPNSH